MMGRLLDRLLPIAIVIVLIAIFALLFTSILFPDGNRRARLTAPPETPLTGEETEGDVIALAPGGAETEARTESADDVTPTGLERVQAAPDEIFAERILERVGYTYGVGQSGACGVPLEAWRHVAVSRDLLSEYGCGAELRLFFTRPNREPEMLDVIIGDTMSPTHSMTINVVVERDEPAVASGLFSGAFIPASELESVGQ